MESMMESPKPKISLKTVIFPVIGLVAFFLYIYLFQVDIFGIISTALRADPIPYAIAIAFSLLEVFFFSTSWRVLANFLKIRLSLARSYLFVWYGIFVDTIIPAESISGEAIRVYLITKEQGEQACGRAVASLVAHRLLGMGMNVAVLIAGMVLIFTETQIDPLIFNLILFLTGGITVTLLLILMFSFKEQWSHRLSRFDERFQTQSQSACVILFLPCTNLDFQLKHTLPSFHVSESSSLMERNPHNFSNSLSRKIHTFRCPI
jgi:uncharacterized protein (TIRG00374 family)